MSFKPVVFKSIEEYVSWVDVLVEQGLIYNKDLNSPTRSFTGLGGRFIKDGDDYKPLGVFTSGVGNGMKNLFEVYGRRGVHIYGKERIK